MHKNVLVNWSIEFWPILLFFGALALLWDSSSGFVFATGLFTASTALALMVAYVRERRIALFPIISGIFVIVFGVLTLYYNEPHIFVLKDTVYNGFSALLLFFGLLKGKWLLKYLFGSLFDIADEGWRILSFRWMIAFVILFITNEYFWRNYPQNIWVLYKFISTLLTIIFGSAQIYLARRYRNPTASPWGLRIVIMKHRQ